MLSPAAVRLAANGPDLTESPDLATGQLVAKGGEHDDGIKKVVAIIATSGDIQAEIDFAGAVSRMVSPCVIA